MLVTVMEMLSEGRGHWFESSRAHHKINDSRDYPVGLFLPITHILKLPLGIVGGACQIHLQNSVENEWLCAQLVAELGLPVASTEMERFGEQWVLVAERFDREWMDGGRWIARLPQEDFCQALGYSSQRKYEVDERPGMAACRAGTATLSGMWLTDL